MANIKFSQLPLGGLMRVGDIPVGLRADVDIQFDFPGAGITDASGNYLFSYNSPGALATNYLTFVSAILGNPATLTTNGTDTDVDILITTKGSGNIDLTPGGSGEVNVPTPVASTNAVTKAYVDGVLIGQGYLLPARAATIENYVATYTNGTAGIGAQLTATSDGIAIIDGVTLNVGDIVLFQNQTSAFQNGLYELYINGTVSAPSVFQRTTNYDTPTDMLYGNTIVIVEGTTNIQTLWTQTSVVATVGTSAVNFAQDIGSFTYAEGSFLSGVTSNIQAQLNLLAPINNPIFTGEVIVPSPVNSMDAATKSYVDEVAAGITYFLPAIAGTTANYVATYSNGTAGVGATLTATADGAAVIDGITLSVGQIVLFKNQTTNYQNGLYYLSTNGSVSAVSIFTRTTNYDTAALMVFGNTINVVQGTLNAQTMWTQNTTVVTVGTDPVLFQQNVGDATAAQIGYLNGVTSNIQTQLNLLAPIANPTFTGTVTIPTPFTLGAVSVTATGTVMNYLVGVTSNIQTQLNLLAPLANPTFTGHVTVPTPTAGTDAVNLTYAQSLVASASYIFPVTAATTGTNYVATYSNGSSGVGATLTATADGAAIIDGVSLALNAVVLFKDQTSSFQNGLYYLSTNGTGSTPSIFTRSTNYDSPTTMLYGGTIVVMSGTLNTQTLWSQDVVVATVGTSAVTFQQNIGDFTYTQGSYLNGVTSNIQTQLNLLAPIASPTFTGTVTIPTPFTIGAVSMTATGTELNYMVGVTSSVQTQLNSKSPTITGAATSIVSSNLGLNLAVISDGSGKIAQSTTTATEIGYVSGVTSAIQTQLGTKAPLASPTFTGTVTFPTPFTLGAISVTTTGTELNYVAGVTSAIQTQLNTKAPTASPTFTGTVTVPTPPVNPTDAASKAYVDASGAGSGFDKIVIQTFTGSGTYTYTPTSGMDYCIIEVLGAGGGGGGSSAGTGLGSAGGGGGAGGYSRIYATAATIGASQTVTIGAAGSAGTSAGGTGGTGGTTSVGSIISATGGVGGSGDTGHSTFTFQQGGLGGAGSSGTLNTNGGPGFGSLIDAAVACTGGWGGSSMYGGGGRGGQVASSTVAAGGAAVSYGSGGGGGACIGTGNTQAGGAGSAGLVIITEYIH